MALLVYVLCALTSLACAILLFRAYARTHMRLLLWSALCFTGFFLNNALLVAEKQTVLTDLSAWRTMPALVGVAVLLYGLVWDSRT